MHFVVTRDHRFSWPVNIAIPDPAGAGQTIEQTFVGSFRLLPEKEAVALSERSATAVGTVAQIESSKAQIRAVLTGWNQEVTDADNMPLPFSADALELAMELSSFRAGVLLAYATAVNARPAAGN